MRDFSITKRDARFLVELVDYCNRGAKVRVIQASNDQEIDGIARHIVSPDTVAFPEFIAPDCRLRVSAFFGEYFIPLDDIYAIGEIDE